MNETNNTKCELIGNMLTSIGERPEKDITPKKIVGIYGLRNKITGKWYVGQSIDIFRRWKDYDNMRCKRQPKIYSALNKYGIENFEKIIVEECQNVSWILDYREMYWIQLYDGIKNGYNLKEGGMGSRHSEETKKVLSKIQKGIKKGPYSEERCKNISKGKKGKKFSEEHKQKLKDAWKHRSPPTEETRNKISIAGKNKKMSESAKEKIRQWNTGKKRSEEAKRSMSEARKRLLNERRNLGKVSIV